MKTVIIKIETQINHLQSQHYSNDPLRQKHCTKEAFDLCLSLYMHVPLIRQHKRLLFSSVYFINITSEQQDFTQVSQVGRMVRLKDG